VKKAHAMTGIDLVQVGVLRAKPDRP